MDETLFSFMILLFLSLMFPIPPISAFNSTQLPLCHDDQRSALLQFKESFIIDEDASSDDPFAYPKVESWKLNADCCSWDGVECDHLTGHVIGLDLSGSCLYGSINSSSTLFRLIHLRKLNLAFNHFNYSQIPPAIDLLPELVSLNMSKSFLSGPIPSHVSNLSSLSSLDLSLNDRLSFQPSDFRHLVNNLTHHIEVLSLSDVEISSTVPAILANASSLSYLDLDNCGLYGEFPVEIFHLPNLQTIHLSGNNLTLLTNTGSNNTFQKFRYIGFADCKLGVFPDFLRYQDKLEFLELSKNSIAGQIPKWLLNMSTDSLQVLDLSSNFLTGFEGHPVVLPWVKATVIALSDNMLQSSPPLPPASIEAYGLSYNNLTGGIPPSFCNLTSLQVLGMTNNKLSGKLPSCLGNFSTNIEVLKLENNDFYGTIPLTFPNGSSWRMIKLSYNQLRGEVPRSLSNCAMLEFLDIGNNQIRDVFPSWLGPLPNLKVLILRSNQFHGVLRGSETMLEFQKLIIIDLSRNNFTGQLPTQYFFNWVAMKALHEDQLAYLRQRTGTNYIFTVFYSMLITSKGTNRGYEQILENLVVVDLSCNRFEGHIPEVIGSLQGLRLLNLSHNNLSSHIPSFLGNITRLESLDLSHNKLSGTIPQQLAQLNSLEVFKVSHNLLVGPIPQGKQFDTFQNDSYQENSGLCGNPLSRKCGSSEAPPRLPSSLDDEDDSSNSLLGFGWESVAIGYASGLVFGLVIGYIVVTEHFEWFARFFRVRVKGTRRARSRMGFSG